MNSQFKQWVPGDIVDLIDAFPLALMVSTAGSEFWMTPLPMLAETDAQGSLTRLIGHMAKSNPHSTALREAPTAHFLFQGPHGYVSPRLLDNRDWAPTWNYAVVRVEADIEFRPDKVDDAIRKLVERMEAAQPGAWSVEELGKRYEQLSRGVVAFDAEVRTVEAKFKLGQDERPEVFQQIVAGLDSADLCSWMQRFSGR